MYARLRAPNNLLFLHQIINRTDSPCLADVKAKPRPDLNIKVAAFTVSEKSDRVALQNIVICHVLIQLDASEEISGNSMSASERYMFVNNGALHDRTVLPNTYFVTKIMTNSILQLGKCLLQRKVYQIRVRVNGPAHESILSRMSKISKGAKIMNRNNQVPHRTQDTNGKMRNSQLDTTNESQEVNPFPAGDHKTKINRRAKRHNKHKTENT